MKSENEIPKYDLAEQIMAGQRKFAATKRIAPKKRDTRYQTPGLRLKTSDTRTQTTIQTKPSKERDTQYSILNTKPSDKIISEIVARDIHNLRKR